MKVEKNTEIVPIEEILPGQTFEDRSNQWSGDTVFMKIMTSERSGVPCNAVNLNNGYTVCISGSVYPRPYKVVPD